MKHRTCRNESEKVGLPYYLDTVLVGQKNLLTKHDMFEILSRDNFRTLLTLRMQSRKLFLAHHNHACSALSFMTM